MRKRVLPDTGLTPWAGHVLGVHVQEPGTWTPRLQNRRNNCGLQATEWTGTAGPSGPGSPGGGSEQWPRQARGF